MPYSANSELPDAIRSRYSERCQSVFRDAFNAAKGDEGSKFAQAHTAARNCMDATNRPQAKAEPLDGDQTEKWLRGERPRAVRIIPFGGLVPGKAGGTDFDGEYFSGRTDIKPHWFSERPVLWHHGADPYGVMGDTVLGKATDLRREDDGWWEDLWLKHGEEKIDRLRRLLSKGASLFGSSTPLETPGVRVRKSGGEILVWPHAEHTISTSPQNLLAIHVSGKALLDNLSSAEIQPAAMTGLLADLDALSTDLQASYPGGEPAAKAGRVLSRASIEKIVAALGPLQELIDDAVTRYQKDTPP
jgi:cation transport regulator ChaB